MVRDQIWVMLSNVCWLCSQILHSGATPTPCPRLTHNPLCVVADRKLQEGFPAPLFRFSLSNTCYSGFSVCLLTLIYHSSAPAAEIMLVFMFDIVAVMTLLPADRT